MPKCNLPSASADRTSPEGGEGMPPPPTLISHALPDTNEKGRRHPAHATIYVGNRGRRARHHRRCNIPQERGGCCCFKTSPSSSIVAAAKSHQCRSAIHARGGEEFARAARHLHRYTTMLAGRGTGEGWRLNCPLSLLRFVGTLPPLSTTSKKRKKTPPRRPPVSAVENSSLISTSKGGYLQEVLIVVGGHLDERDERQK
nr:hypothetical protein Iba_chr05bCG7220 [Ipomoea batatas]